MPYHFRGAHMACYSCAYVGHTSAPGLPPGWQRKPCMLCCQSFCSIVHPHSHRFAKASRQRTVLQEYSHMARRGHLYGMVSTYNHSWFLKADGRGNLWISRAVSAVERGNVEHISVTEVCQLDSFPQVTCKLRCMQVYVSCTVTHVLASCATCSRAYG